MFDRIYLMKKTTILLIILTLLAIGITVYNRLTPQPFFVPLISEAGEDPATDADSSQVPVHKPEPIPVQSPIPALPDTSLTTPSPEPQSLEPQHYYDLEIVKSTFKLYLNRDHKQFKVYDVALGNQGSDKLEKTDLSTPLGNFYIRSIENSSQRSPKNGRSFGPWFIRLATGHFETSSRKAWSGIGIQGGAQYTELGSSLRTDSVIMQDKDLIELKEYIYEDYKQFRIPVRIIP